MGQLTQAQLDERKNYREEQGEPNAVPKHTYARGMARYGPFFHRYWVVKRNKEFLIAFEGKNNLKVRVALSHADFLHHFAAQSLVSYLEEKRMK